MVVASNKLGEKLPEAGFYLLLREAFRDTSLPGGLDVVCEHGDCDAQDCPVPEVPPQYGADVLSVAAVLAHGGQPQFWVPKPECGK